MNESNNCNSRHSSSSWLHCPPNLDHHDDVQQLQHATNCDEDNSNKFQGGRHKHFKTGIGPGLVDHNPHQDRENNGFDDHTWDKVAPVIVLQCRHSQVGERSIEQAASEDDDAEHGDGDDHAGGEELQLHLLEEDGNYEANWSNDERGHQVCEHQFIKGRFW